MIPRMKMTWKIITIPRLKTDPKWRWPQKWIQSWFTWLGTILRSHTGWISIYDFIHPILCQKMNEQNEEFQDKTKDKITRQHSATFRYMCCILDSNARRCLACTANLIQGVPQYCFHFQLAWPSPNLPAQPQLPVQPDFNCQLGPRLLLYLCSWCLSVWVCVLG